MLELLFVLSGQCGQRSGAEGASEQTGQDSVGRAQEEGQFNNIDLLSFFPWIQKYPRFKMPTNS